MRIGELARRSGFSVDTLRYYEKIGLIPKPARDPGGQRDFGAADLRWLRFLERLNATGMGIRDRLRYAALREQGDATAGARRDLLAAHRAAVAARIEELNETLVLLDDKIAGYAQLDRRPCGRD